MSEPLPGIWRMPLSGGDEELMIAGANYALWQVMDDGIYYMDLQDIYEEDLRSPGLWFFDFVTGTSQRITELEGASEFGLAVSPDRRWALYQREENEYDIMLVENFR